jgi:hypothetical protein
MEGYYRSMFGAIQPTEKCGSAKGRCGAKPAADAAQMQ